MRNLRKLTAVVIALALVVTSMAASFAATTPANADKASTLKDLGLYAGTDANDVAAGLDGALTTQDSLIFLAKLFGYNDAANQLSASEVNNGLAKFADAASISNYARNVVAYSAINGILSGSPKSGKLYVGAKDTVTAARFATFMLKQMGYTVPAYTQSVAQISEVDGSKVLATITGNLTRDIAVGMMYGALTAEKASQKTVIADIIGNDAAKKAIAEKAGLVVAEIIALDVEKITVSNLREMIVTFNKAIDATQAVKVANYKINDNAVEAATLSEDGKTVTLRTLNAKNMSNYATDVKLFMESELGFAADKTVTGITAKDTTIPSAVSVSATGPKNLKVTLSEPLNESYTAQEIANSLKIDAGLVAIDSTGVSLSGNQLSVRTYSDLAEGSHKIEFLAGATGKLFDNAGYQIQNATLSFDYVKDTSPLSLSVVESTETTVTVKFNKAIAATSFAGNNNVKITHTYNTDANQVLGGTVTSTDDQKFVINFNTKPFPPGATTVFIGYVSDSGEKIQDNYGNKLAATSFTVNTSADLTKPTATAEFVDAKTVKVTFSEVVTDATAQDKANYVLKKGSDVVSIVTAVLDDTKKVLTLTTDNNALNGTTYSLLVKNVKDKSVAANQIDEVTLTFTGTDMVAPAVDTDKSKLVAADKYKVVFSEAMDVASITDKAVYKINTAALRTEDTVEAVDGNKAVIITFKNATTIASLQDTNNTLVVGRVKDAAGNWTAEFSNPVANFGKTVATVDLAEYQLTSKNTIKLKFNDSLQSMSVNDFQYSVNGGTTWTSPNAISASVVDGATYITLTTNDIATAIGTDVEVKSVGTTATQSIYGSKLAFDTADIGNTLVIVDKCAPAKSGIAGTLVADNNESSNKLTLGTVVITYNESIYGASVQDTDFTVEGYTVSNVEVSGNIVTITVKTLDYGSYEGDTTTANISVKQVGEIQDSAKNSLAAQDAWTLTTLND